MEKFKETCDHLQVNYRAAELIKARSEMEPILEVIEKHKFMTELNTDFIFNEYKSVFESSQVGITANTESIEGERPSFIDLIQDFKIRALQDKIALYDKRFRDIEKRLGRDTDTE